MSCGCRLGYCRHFHQLGSEVRLQPYLTSLPTLMASNCQQQSQIIARKCSEAIILRAILSYRIYTCICKYVCVTLRNTISRALGGKEWVQNGISIATWIPSSNLERTKRQRSGQIYHIVLPRKVYYSSRISRVCL